MTTPKTFGRLTLTSGRTLSDGYHPEYLTLRGSTDRRPYGVPAKQYGEVGSERVSETGRPTLERLILLVRLECIEIAIRLVNEERIAVVGIAIELEP